MLEDIPNAIVSQIIETIFSHLMFLSGIKKIQHVVFIVNACMAISLFFLKGK